MTTMISATRITDIDAAIDRLKIAMTYCGDSSTNALLTDRMADLLIERGNLLAKNVEKASTKQNVAAIAPIIAPEPVIEQPRQRKERSDKGVKRGPRKPQSVAASKPVVKTETKTAKASKLNWDNKLMLSDSGTASQGQRKWLADNGIDATMVAAISMADASNYRALVQGRISAAQYNAL